jgi:hypothetical protein
MVCAQGGGTMAIVVLSVSGAYGNGMRFAKCCMTDCRGSLMKLINRFCVGMEESRTDAVLRCAA